MYGRLVVDLSLISENQFRDLKDRVWLHAGKNLGTHAFIPVEDDYSITDIKVLIQVLLRIHADNVHIYSGGILMQDGVQIREINMGVEMNPGFTLKLKATETLFQYGVHNQAHIFFNAVFRSGIGLAFEGIPPDSGPGCLSTPDDRTKLENPAKRRRISTKSPLSPHERAPFALRSTR